MSWLRTIGSEVLALFVDDGAFAAAILVWLAIVGLSRTALGLGAFWSGAVLFVGLAAALLYSVVRRARA